MCFVNDFRNQGAQLSRINPKPRVFCVVAARPNFVKIAPIIAEIEKQGALNAVLVHTGQHYDLNMSDVFFRDLEIREPDVHLGIGSGSHAEQTGKLMIAFEKLCENDRPDIVLVVGDVNATVACSLVAAKMSIPVAHVEAGLRSGDRCMPEEINRIVTDHLSDLLFTTSRDAGENLEAEGINSDKIHFTGNVMVDSLLKNLEQTTQEETVLNVLGPDFQKKEFALLTIHRPSNVDVKETLLGWIEALEKVARRIELVCPLHPRTDERLVKFGLKKRFEASINTRSPLGYLQFVALMRKTRLVITDSGGLQEEATMLGVPCLTIRENTERPVTIKHGTNRVIGIDPTYLITACEQELEREFMDKWSVPELWDGHAAERIYGFLMEYVETKIQR